MTPHLLLGLFAGVALGLAYFGGLWWTLGRVATWRRPQRALLTSFVVRALLVLPAFVALALHGPASLAAALVGFVAARVALQALTVRSGGGSCG